MIAPFSKKPAPERAFSCSDYTVSNTFSVHGVIVRNTENRTEISTDCAQTFKTGAKAFRIYSCLIYTQSALWNSAHAIGDERDISPP
jgi:hypothetical protein